MSGYPSLGGLPHSDTHGSTPARGSPWLFAACHVLHRLLVPRHPPNALLILDTKTSHTRRDVHHARKPSSDPACPPYPLLSKTATRPNQTTDDPMRFYVAQITGIHLTEITPGHSRTPPNRRQRTRSHTPLNPRRRPVGRPSREELSRSDIKPNSGTPTSLTTSRITRVQRRTRT